ncbi:MAG: nuclear transport factor 2 family protein [Polaromonas sp.]
MHPNQTRLENFYAAFARLDADAMAACYAPDAQFDDEVFSLRGHEQVTGMWRMLCAATQAKGRDMWKLNYSGIEADGNSGKAHWEADYRFSASRRMVHNVIDGEFEFNEEGLITRHRDRFDFWAWSRQALGWPGVLLGWSSFFRRQVRRQAAANLQKYLTQGRS